MGDDGEVIEGGEVGYFVIGGDCWDEGDGVGDDGWDEEFVVEVGWVGGGVGVDLVVGFFFVLLGGEVVGVSIKCLGGLGGLGIGKGFGGVKGGVGGFNGFEVGVRVMLDFGFLVGGVFGGYGGLLFIEYRVYCLERFVVKIWGWCGCK